MRFAVLTARTLAGAVLAGVAALAALSGGPSRPSRADAVASEESGKGTLSDRDRRLAEKGMAAGSPMLIRIFKAEFQFELWMQKGDRFELFATYPICYWSGTLGPKLHEGDMQAPEGFYAVGMNQIHRHGRWPRSLNIGYPNVLDRAHARTGSLILVHGGCTSTGCFAMTNPIMEEIYSLAEQALQKGQERIPIHVFPFRMTDANLGKHAHDDWRSFWLTLKTAYDLFERTRVPPKVGICNKQYVVSAGEPAGNSVVPSDPGVPCAESEGGGAMPIISAETEAAAEEEGPIIRARKAATQLRRHRLAARKARKAYAAARRARMAAHGKRTRERPAQESSSQIEHHPSGPPSFSGSG